MIEGPASPAEVIRLYRAEWTANGIVIGMLLGVAIGWLL